MKVEEEEDVVLRSSDALAIARAIHESKGKHHVPCSSTGAPRAVIVSADDFFVHPTSGKYEFNVTKLNQAHVAAQCKFVEALAANTPRVIVDNTSSQAWEYQLYTTLAKTFGYEVTIVEIECANDLVMRIFKQRGQHAVPDAMYASMRARWEHDVCAIMLPPVVLANEKEQLAEMIAETYLRHRSRSPASLRFASRDDIDHTNRGKDWNIRHEPRRDSRSRSDGENKIHLRKVPVGDVVDDSRHDRVRSHIRVDWPLKTRRSRSPRDNHRHQQHDCRQCHRR